MGATKNCVFSTIPFWSWSKSHCESFWHPWGLQEKLFAFASHFLQAEQGISKLLPIATMNTY